MSYIFSCRPSHFEPSEWLDNLVEAAWGMLQNVIFFLSSSRQKIVLFGDGIARNL
jgi:hypothetical protein